jgi:hypothetical protein
MYISHMNVVLKKTKTKKENIFSLYSLSRKLKKRDQINRIS